MPETAQKNKYTFSAKGSEYAVERPNAKTSEIAALEYNRVFSQSLKNGALLREGLEKYMIEQGIWDKEKEAEYQSLLKTITEIEKSLSQGGIKLSEAKTKALLLKECRVALQTLIGSKNALDVNTAQGQAENARFNCLLVNCLVYNESGDPVFNSIDEYLEASLEGDEVATLGAENFASMFFGLDKDYEKNLPENKFLKQHKFVNDKGQLVDDNGDAIDAFGKKVDENGRYIDDDGNLINYFGDPVSEEGQYAFETSPFLDEDGKPLSENENSAAQEEGVKVESKEKKKPRGRPKKPTE